MHKIKYYYFATKVRSSKCGVSNNENEYAPKKELVNITVLFATVKVIEIGLSSFSTFLVG